MSAKAPSMGPRDPKYDADMVRLVESLRKGPRKPAKRTTAIKPAAKKALPKKR